MALSKIFMVGAGNVGATAVSVMASKQLGSIFLYDIIEDFAIGKAMDINQSSPFFNSDSRVLGTNTIEDIKGSDIVVVTAGIPRSDGMTRLDLLNKNLEIISDVGSNIMKFCPDSKVLIISNPVDVLTWHLKNTWPDMNVYGLGCSLDTLRFRYFLAESLGVSVDSVNGIVIGTHNNNMIPMIEYATVGGVPVNNLLSDSESERVVENTRTAGTDIVHKLKSRSGFYAAGSVVAQVVESMVFDKNNIFPLSTYCSGEFGYSDICLALPVVVGRDPVPRVVKIELGPERRKAMEICALQMQEITGSINKM